MPKIPTSSNFIVYCYSRIVIEHILSIYRNIVENMIYLLHNRRRRNRRPQTVQVKVGNLCWQRG